MINEHPIFFSPKMVRALLNGSKKQTRRLVKPKPETDGFECLYGGQRIKFRWREDTASVHVPDYLYIWPSGKVGDKLWVRETFAKVPVAWKDSKPNLPIVLTPQNPDEGIIYKADVTEPYPYVNWCPGTFMPRAMARIELEITEIRIQQLQAISEQDAMYEGVNKLCDSETFRDAFQRLWNTIHKPVCLDGWDANPWVWAVSFRRL